MSNVSQTPAPHEPLVELNDVGTGRYDFLAAATNVAYSLPRRMYMLFPYSAVIGAMIGLMLPSPFATGAASRSASRSNTSGTASRSRSGRS